MHHKLLGSTALVSAGFLLASASPAKAQIELVISGYTEFGVTAGTNETLSDGDGDRGYDFFMDNEVNFLANGTSDTGVDYGSKIELEVGSGAGPGAENAFIDEAVLFFSGAFGRVELGREDGAEDIMFLGGEDAQAGTGGFDGDTANLIPFQIQDSGDVAKVTYYSPRVAGFQIGATYSPDLGDDGGDDTGGDFEDFIGAGANWTGDFGGFDVGLTAVASWAEPETPGDDLLDWSVGGRTGFGGFQLGAAYVQRTEANEADIYNVGLKYGFGPANASVGWVFHDPDVGEEQNLYVVSADVGLMPGVVLKGDVSYVDEDPGTVTGDDESLAGVLTVQLNY